MNIELLLSLAIIHAVALVSPGPDFALVVRLASQESRSTAIASAVGISIAILIHTILSLTGVSLIIKSSQTLYTIVQMVGAGYLAWMGFSAVKGSLQHWKAKVSVNSSPFKLNQLTPKQGFMQGLWTNLLNPKAMVFFIILFSAMITPDVSFITKLSATVIMLGLSLIWFVLIALILSKPMIQQRVQKAAPAINLFTGLLFMAVSSAIMYNLLEGVMVLSESAI
ncbi:LysE family translocator [Moritella viscosa]|uniref:Threonine efflux protein, putative n=1 Tax=Moritella viscosa TaxID=80854 RepID=A0ABY1H8Z9_9GAMM|nr:LysE family translocator [Moritella viscosa]SGY86113.1 Threonine efflux protein, putative [Moritella viscosa]SGY87433.1 Threonine efflux protein, putative [Moritella viscosa]SGY87451.1 Threonine efflux protein, putative [Moritella viscosa]SGY89532.1 Threonine efflux protein, putative [Moritella viscosa]SHO24892.1 Threonine efflux protein, putative [Moritella viscosa]